MAHLLSLSNAVEALPLSVPCSSGPRTRLYSHPAPLSIRMGTGHWFQGAAPSWYSLPSESHGLATTPEMPP